MISSFAHGDLIKSRLIHEAVSVWATDHYEKYIGDFQPTQVGIITEKSADRNAYKILIDDLHGWVFETFIQRI